MVGFIQEQAIILVGFVVFLIGLFIFAYWYLEQIDKMEEAYRRRLFSEVEALTQRLRTRRRTPRI